MKDFHVIATAWHIGKIIAWIIASLCGISVAGDEFRIKPIPHKETLPPPAAPTGRANDETSPSAQEVQAPVGLRDLPTIQVLGDPRFCQPCAAAAEALKGTGIKHRIYPAPQWVYDGDYGTPVFAWQVEATDAGWRYAFGWHGLEALRAEVEASLRQYDEQCSLGAPAAGQSYIEQILKFAPVGSRVSIELPQKSTVPLGDGASVTYSRLSGKVVTVDGQPALVFDQPVPVADLRKFGLKVSVNVNFVKFEPPATAAVGTAFGKYRIRFEQAE